MNCLLDRINIGVIVEVEESPGGPMVRALLCSICGKPLLPGQRIDFDHVHADVHGGAHEYRNLRPIHYDPCHKGKSKKDVAAKAKIDRIVGVTGNRPKRKIQKGQKLRSGGFQKRGTPCR